jgi:hypothetical protein
VARLPGVLAVICRERPPHGVTGVTFVLMPNDEGGDFVGAVHHSTDIIRVSDSGRCGETGRAELLPCAVLEYAEDRAERGAGRGMCGRVVRVGVRCNRVGLRTTLLLASPQSAPRRQYTPTTRGPLAALRQAGRTADALGRRRRGIRAETEQTDSRGIVTPVFPAAWQRRRPRLADLCGRRAA